MRISKRIGNIIGYIVLDYFVSALAWCSFFIFRKVYVEQQPFDWSIYDDSNFKFGVLLIPIFWCMLYAVADSYHSIYRMSRMTEFLRTLGVSIVGCLILFFVFILDDLRYYELYALGYRSYYTSFWGLLAIHTTLAICLRMWVLTWASRQVKSGKVLFKTLILGGDQKAVELYEDILKRKKARGYYHFVGFLSFKDEPAALSFYLPQLGTIENLPAILQKFDLEEVILAFEPENYDQINNLLRILSPYKVLIKVLPSMYDLLLGKVKINQVYGAILIEISPQFMPIWFRVVKRSMDIAGSLIFLILLFPLYIYIAIRVKLSSPGSIFYKQERVGLDGKPFMIYKFRSMRVDAEQEGKPQLSSDNDSRVTPWGKTMRKYRLDELPQFWNTLKGDMALVGPRPERQFYLDQIAQLAPNVWQLQKVKPGITSWGQVQYGYASNVEEMVQRLKFDLLYIENISLALDIKIMFYTILVIVQGRGK